MNLIFFGKKFHVYGPRAMYFDCVQKCCAFCEYLYKNPYMR